MGLEMSTGKWGPPFQRMSPPAGLISDFEVW